MAVPRRPPNKTMQTRRYILGTAGHVDHGKTELVKALTGWDTDRLKEEKQRGISIELGFAPLRLGDDTVVGIVDVPGHERFVKHMVAGAGGIDLAMLLVAADEGVMPQTKEHLEVISSLAVSRGVIVISKCDLADRELVAMVADDIRELARGTPLEDAPVVETSAKSGTGLDELKDTLLELTRDLPARDTSGAFRLAVDRVFHKKGIGVVVTGSCYSGAVAPGDDLALLPAEKSARVRELQSFGDKRNRGFAGERLAIALQGVKLQDVSRGDMLVTPGRFTVSYMLDARLRVARYGNFKLKQRERVRVHHGAREVLGRVVLLEGEELRSGDSALVQLRLEQPVVAAEHDYFVIRKYSPARVLGGGIVIDARAQKHRVRDTGVVEELRVLEQGDPIERVARLVDAAGLDGVAQNDVDAEQASALTKSGAVLVIEGRLFDKKRIAALADEVYALARAAGEASPLAPGIDKEELRQKVRFPHATPLFNRVLDTLSQFARIHVVDNHVRADTKEHALPPELRREVSTLEKTIADHGLLYPKESEIASTWDGKRPLAEALRYLRDTGAVLKVGNDGFVHRKHIAACTSKLVDWFAAHDTLSVAEFKNLFGLTRKHAVPLLEHLDATRVTRRRDNVRAPGPALKASEAQES